jgi:hypothetical protein
MGNTADNTTQATLFRRMRDHFRCLIATVPPATQEAARSNVATFRTAIALSIDSRPRQRQTFVMRALAALLVFAGVAFGIYEYSLKKMPTTDPGTAPTQAISLTGVRGDLLQIGQSERRFLALNDHCASIDELISTNSITMRQPERDGYTYTLDCGAAGNFRATARHAPAPEGSPIRYPTLSIDQNMQVTEIQ